MTHTVQKETEEQKARTAHSRTVGRR